MPYNLHNMKF